jgi:hypothetical protein
VSASKAEYEPPRAARRVLLWRIVFVALALVWAVPVVSKAYEQFNRVSQQARTRLIEHHRLWELQPDFRGRPEVWTRAASRLLNDRQILSRVAQKYSGQSAEIELEYRRDLMMARAEVFVVALAWWAAPLAALYGVALCVRRRKPAMPQKVEPASVSDPRYRPPDAG